MTNTQHTNPRYIPVADTAKLVRKTLKAEFPGVKFSVRSSSYSGGASIDVSWTDGPTWKSVDDVVGIFESRRFDGTIDMAYGVSHWYCPEHGVSLAQSPGSSGSRGVDGPFEFPVGPCIEAEEVGFGSHYVMCQRNYSDQFRARITAQIEAETGEHLDMNRTSNHHMFHREASATAA